MQMRQYANETICKLVKIPGLCHHVMYVNPYSRKHIAKKVFLSRLIKLTLDYPQFKCRPANISIKLNLISNIVKMSSA